MKKIIKLNYNVVKAESRLLGGGNILRYLFDEHVYPVIGLRYSGPSQPFTKMVSVSCDEDSEDIVIGFIYLPRGGK